jgi:aminoglycoside phosphotransferase (APT) family kinase protein
MFDDDFRVKAVFDWEMARLGNPEFDLAWYLWFDKHFTEGIGVPRLSGFPSDAESIARWEEKVGRKAEHLEWYTVFTMVFFAAIMMRVVQSNIAHGADPDELGPMETNNLATQMLAKHFGLAAPE